MPVLRFRRTALIAELWSLGIDYTTSVLRFHEASPQSFLTCGSQFDTIRHSYRKHLHICQADSRLSLFDLGSGSLTLVGGEFCA